MKRIFLRTVCVLLLLQLFAFSICAQTPVSALSSDTAFTLSDAVGQAGQRVELALQLSSAVELDSIALALNYDGINDYDTEALSFIGFADPDQALLDKCFVYAFDSEKKAITLALNTPEAVSGNLCKMQFAIADNAAPGKYAVKMYAKVKNGAEAKTALFHAGTVVVAPSADDILNHLRGINPLTGKALLGADLDGNEIINTRDINLLLSVREPAPLTTTGFTSDSLAQPGGASPNAVSVLKKAEVTPEDTDLTAAFAAANYNSFTLTYDGPRIAAGQPYLIMMVEGTKESYTVTPESILYVNQNTAGTGSKGAAVSFHIYPCVMKNGVVLLSGLIDGELKQIPVATVNAEYMLKGDINGDQVVDIKDALLLFQHSMLPNLYPVSYTGMDFNGDGVVNVLDAKKLLQ